MGGATLLNACVYEVVFVVLHNTDNFDKVESLDLISLGFGSD